MRSTQLLFLALLFMPQFALSQWVQKPTGYGNELTTLHFRSETLGYSSGNLAGVFRTEDGGETWKRVHEDGFVDIDFYDNIHAFGASIVGRSMAWSVFSGERWFYIDPPESNSLKAVSAASQQTAYFAGTGGVLWKTIERKKAVQVLETGTYKTILDVEFPTFTTGFFVTSNGVVQRTLDEGETWDTVANYPDQYFSKLHFLNDSTGFVTGMMGMILKTTDQGDSWINIGPQVDVLFKAIDFYDADHGLAAGLNGEAYYTNDGGKIWRGQDTWVKVSLNDVKMLTTNSAVIVGEKGLVLKNADIIGSTGVPSPILGPPVAMYPNPTLDRLHLETEGVIEEIEIFTGTGQSVMAFKSLTTSDYEMDVSQFLPGVYYLKVHSKNAQSLHRFVKN